MILSFKFLIAQSDGLTPCDWMLQSRIWLPQQTCELQSNISLSSTMSANNQPYVNKNISVVNVLFVPPFIQGRCQYSLLQIDQNTTLANAFFYINATIDLSNASDLCSFENISVSVFDQFAGSIENVSVTGNISIVNFTTPAANLIISQLLGNVFPTGRLSNVSSNLTFTVNGKQLQQFQQILSSSSQVNNTIIKTYNNTFTNSSNQQSYNMIYFTNQAFDDFYYYSMAAINTSFISIVNLAYTNFSMPVLQNFTISIPNGIQGQSQTYTVFSSFGISSNLFNNLYQASIKYYLEKQNAVLNLTQQYFYGNNSVADKNYTANLYSDLDSNYTLSAYFSNYIAVGFPNDKLSSYCNQNMLLDVTIHSCISQTNCVQQGRFVYQSLCLVICPSNYYQYNHSCFSTCPLQISLISNFSDSSVNPICIPCSGANQSLTNNGCLTNSTAVYQYTVPQTQLIRLSSIILKTSTQQTVYFVSCLDGMITNTSNKSCYYPNKQADCTSNGYTYFVNLNNQNYLMYNMNPMYCTNLQEPGLYLLNGTKTLTNLCSGNVSLSQICYQNVQVACQYGGVIINQNLCQVGCGFQYVYNGSECTNSSCPDMMYSNEQYAICMRCNLDYDGGQFFNRTNFSCQSNCSSAINETANGSTCENVLSKVYCPYQIQFRQQGNGLVNQLCVSVNCAFGSYWNRATNACVTQCSYQNGSICESSSDSIHCPFYYSNGSLTSNSVCSLLKCQTTYHSIIGTQVFCNSSCNAQFIDVDNSCQQTCTSQIFQNETGTATCVTACPQSSPDMQQVGAQKQCVASSNMITIIAGAAAGAVVIIIVVIIVIVTCKSKKAKITIGQELKCKPEVFESGGQLQQNTNATANDVNVIQHVIPLPSQQQANVSVWTGTSVSSSSILTNNANTTMQSVNNTTINANTTLQSINNNMSLQTFNNSTIQSVNESVLQRGSNLTNYLKTANNEQSQALIDQVYENQDQNMIQNNYNNDNEKLENLLSQNQNVSIQEQQHAVEESPEMKQKTVKNQELLKKKEAPLSSSSVKGNAADTKKQNFANKPSNKAAGKGGK